MQSWRVLAGTTILIATLAGALWGYSGGAPTQFSAEHIRVIASLSLSNLPGLPADPSNRFGDRPEAARLGEALFSDTGMSASGTIACASCHIPSRGFDDQALPGKGVGVTTRRAMPLAGTAYSPWFFWDGRTDSQWSQALGPIENLGEQAFSRVEVVRFVADNYAKEYQALFGALPELQDMPVVAGPFGTPAGRQAWAALSDAQRAQINAAFANVGKAIASFERTIAPVRTRFDDFADALAAGTPGTSLSPTEQLGLAVFVGKGQCAQCHNGPLLSDHFFHNTGVPLADGLPVDLGRLPALQVVDADEFNCLGPHSDAKAEQCGELRFKATSDQLLRAFKTPSLRGVGQRAPYMHAGQFADLDAVVAHYNAAPWAEIGVTELHRPNLTADEIAALIAFLKII